MITAGPTYHEMTRLHPVLMLHLGAQVDGLNVQIVDRETDQLVIQIAADEATAWLNVLKFRGIDAIEHRCAKHGHHKGVSGTLPCTCAKVFRSRLFDATSRALANRERAI